MAGIPVTGKGNVVVTKANVPNVVKPAAAKGSSKNTSYRAPK
jgi:hypothetical protein